MVREYARYANVQILFAKLVRLMKAEEKAIAFVGELCW